jgi:tetratricopeptide (TPR) repeat protein
MLDPNFILLQRKGDNEQDEYQFLLNMETAVEALLTQSKLVKALECASHVLALRKDISGQTSEEFVTFLKSLATRTFQATVHCLEANEGTQVLAALKLLEEMLLGQSDTEAYVTQICEVYNHLACYYKRVDKLRLTKTYLEKALELSRVYKEAPIDRASLHLNMCAVLSGLNKHKEAVRFGGSAVQYAQEELVNLKLNGGTETTQKVTLLAVAYHNLAVEEEHLRNFDAALEWYNKAVNFMETHGSQSSLLEEFRKSAAAAHKAYQRNKRRTTRPSSATHTKKTVNLGLQRTLQLIKKQMNSDSSVSSSSVFKDSERDYMRGSGSAFAPALRRAGSSATNPRASVRFDTRFPLEVRPSSFESFRREQNRPRGMTTEAKSLASTAKEHRDPRRPIHPNLQTRPQPALPTKIQTGRLSESQAVMADRTPLRQGVAKPSVVFDSETEVDLRELEGLGLLVHTDETPTVGHVKSTGPVIVRGSSRTQGVTREQPAKLSEAYKGNPKGQVFESSLPKLSSSRPDTSSEAARVPLPRARPTVTAKLPDKPKLQMQSKGLSSESSSSSDSYEKPMKSQQAALELEKAAMKVQAAFRGWKARQELKIMKTKPTKVKFRGGVKLSPQVLAIVTVTEERSRSRLKVVAESGGKKWKLLVDAQRDLSELVGRLMLNTHSQLVLRPDRPEKHALPIDKPKASPTEKPKTSAVKPKDPSVAKDLIRQKDTAQEEVFKITYEVPCVPQPLPITVTREGSRLALAYTADKAYSIPLQDNVQGLSTAQVTVYIQQTVLPGLSVSEGMLRYNSVTLGPVEETFDLSQYDADKVALIQSRVSST